MRVERLAFGWKISGDDTEHRAYRLDTVGEQDENVTKLTKKTTLEQGNELKLAVVSQLSGHNCALAFTKLVR